MVFAEPLAPLYGTKIPYDNRGKSLVRGEAIRFASHLLGIDNRDADCDLHNDHRDINKNL